EYASAQDGSMSAFAKGDHVEWNSEAGMVSGVIRAVHTEDVEFKGRMRRCSPEEPQYDIESDKTDHGAMHKESALKKVDGGRPCVPEPRPTNSAPEPCAPSRAPPALRPRTSPHQPQASLCRHHRDP